MVQPGGLQMERVLVGRHSRLNSGLRWLCSAAMSLLFTLAFAGTAFGQDVPISGTVTNAAGAPIPGVTVRVEGTDVRTSTDVNGVYRIAAPATATLTFAHVGSKPQVQAVGGRRTVDVTMTNVTYLEEVVVTAYTEQRRADITGAVASVGHGRGQEADGCKRGQGARCDCARRDGPDQRLARRAEHGPNPRNQLVPEQRSPLRHRRHAGSGFVRQLPEPRGHSIDSGSEGRVGRIDLRIARQQRRHRDRDDEEWTSRTAESHAAGQNGCGISGKGTR